MAGDILYDPLGQDDKPARAGRARRPLLLGLGAVVALTAVAAVGFYLRKHEGDRHQSVVAAIETKPAVAAVPASTPTAAATGTPGVLSADQIDQQSGVSITRPQGSSASGATIIQIPQDLSVALQHAPDPRLVEKSRFGLLPRRGADGSRAAEVYARPVVVDGALPSNAPRIAIVVGGMGLNSTLTTNAAAKMPPAVSFAFAPYGDLLDVQVQAARDAGHEAILQIPMAGTDQADAMSHMLTLGTEPRETLDRLHWLMSRCTGYVGIASYLGGTFTADAPSFDPVLGDAANRGLLYFDDGTSARSLAVGLAPSHRLPIVRADAVIDRLNDVNAVRTALGALEQRARSRGFAVGFASGRPDALDQIARFAKDLSARGIALVPVSALAAEAPEQRSAQP